MRIFVLANVDILLTLPMGIVTVVLTTRFDITPGYTLPFYYGWNITHTVNWPPVSVPYTELDDLSDLAPACLDDRLHVLQRLPGLRLDAALDLRIRRRGVFEYL